MKDNISQSGDNLTAFESELRHLRPRPTTAQLPDSRENRMAASVMAPSGSNPVLSPFFSPTALALFAIFWITGVAFGAIGSFAFISAGTASSNSTSSWADLPSAEKMSFDKKRPTVDIEKNIPTHQPGFDKDFESQTAGEDPSENAEYIAVFPRLRTIRPMGWHLGDLAQTKKLSDLVFLTQITDTNNGVSSDDSDSKLRLERVGQANIAKFIDASPKTRHEVLNELVETLSLTD